jgi:hypothetical protein
MMYFQITTRISGGSLPNSVDWICETELVLRGKLGRNDNVCGFVSERGTGRASNNGGVILLSWGVRREKLNRRRELTCEITSLAGKGELIHYHWVYFELPVCKH